jgi:hypothetical protein
VQERETDENICTNKVGGEEKWKESKIMIIK